MYRKNGWSGRLACRSRIIRIAFSVSVVGQEEVVGVRSGSTHMVVLDQPVRLVQVRERLEDPVEAVEAALASATSAAGPPALMSLSRHRCHLPTIIVA